MTLRIKVFGVEFLTVEFDGGDPISYTPVDRGIKRLSSWWVDRMSR